MKLVAAPAYSQTSPIRGSRLRPDLTAGERNAIWEHATRTAADATAQIRNLAWTDPAAAADAAWATSDTLHVAAAMLGSRILRQAADAYDRAARSPYGRIPPPSPVGNRLRQAARLISAFAYLTQDRSMAPILLITKLAALAEAVAELRQSQQHAARPPPHYAPLSGSTPPPARRRRRHPAQRHAPAPPPSSPGCPSPHQPGLPHDHPHPDSPALIRTAPGHHAGHHRHGHAAPAPDRAARTAGHKLLDRSSDGLAAYAVPVPRAGLSAEA